MACDMLGGLDPAALAPPEEVPALTVHLVSGLGTARLQELFPGAGQDLSGRIRACPAREVEAHWDGAALGRSAAALLGDTAAPGRLAQRAQEDFRHFWKAKLDGDIPASTRFIVDLCTPYSCLAAALPEADALAALAQADARMRGELAALFEVLPAEELTLQWSVTAETRVWETRGRDLAAPRGLPERLLESFAVQAAAVPAQAALGYHFCHRGGGFMGVPVSTGQVSRLIGAMIASTDREPAFVHVPVPRECDEPAYFDDLAQLRLWPQMGLYLGLIHPGDTVAAARRRLAIAALSLPIFGLSTACGMDPAEAVPLLQALLEGQIPIPG